MTVWIDPPANYEKMNEKQFSAEITMMAAHHGWIRTHHETFSIGTKPGYPDLTLIHPEHGVLWLEVKGGGKHTIYTRQIDWIEDLQRCGQHAYIVRPCDYGFVQHILRGEVSPPTKGEGAVPIELTPLLLYQNRSKAK